MLNEKCKGKCFRSFPKKECKATNSDVDGYPEYRRRLTGPNAHIIPELGKHKNVDNSWVVPYNPYLLLKYDTHINLEICTSVSAYKYIFKYVMKGGDKAEIKLRMVNEDGAYQTYCDLDEIKNWADSRYISAHEALWRIFDFPTNSLSHTVQRLSVHLPGEQNVTFTEENIQSVVDNPKDSTLDAYFVLNEGTGYSPDEIQLARSTLYHDIPQHFRWEDKTRRWERRIQKLPELPVMHWNNHKPVIGRMYNCSPRDIERFSLRLLLISRKGCTSFKDLRTVPGMPEQGIEPIVCASFHSAAKLLGLIQDEEEWHLCLDEAYATDMPHQMQFLFATILMNCEISDPQDLWDRHCHQLIVTQAPHWPMPYSRNNALFDAYHKVDAIIQQNNPYTSLEETFQVKPPVRDNDEPVFQPADSIPQATTQEELDRQATEMEMNLNTEQRSAYTAILSSILSNAGGTFFIDGPGGTGKSFVYKTLTKKLKSLGLTLCACASTGIAATIIDGCTAHKLFGIPMDLDFDSGSIIPTNSKSAAIIRNCACIIWDEAPSSHRFTLELVNRFLQEVCRNTRPFGGKTLILGGDWRQTLPIVLRGTNAHQIAACLRMSPLWPHFDANTFRLTHNMRATNPLFAEWLLDIGNGICDDRIDLPSRHIRVVHNSLALIHATFGNVLNEHTLPNLTHHVILCPTNKNTALFNHQILSMVEGRSHMRYSIDYNIIERENHPQIVPEEFLHTLLPPGMPPYDLNLKIGAVYMLLRNMCVKEGLCNGTRFTLIEIDGHVLQCKIIQDDKTKPEKIFRLPRITTTPPQHYPFPFKRRQYPIRPCFAMTINKSQGGTFDVEGLDASSPIFSHGQAYVALSRVRDFDKITVLTPNMETTIQNMVFPQVFDKDYIDTQIRQRNERPILPDRMETDYAHMPPDHQNPYIEEELEAYNDQFDNMEEYDPYDGVQDDSCLGRFMADEMAYEEDWIATDSMGDIF